MSLRGEGNEGESNRDRGFGWSSLRVGRRRGGSPDGSRTGASCREWTTLLSSYISKNMSNEQPDYSEIVEGLFIGKYVHQLCFRAQVTERQRVLTMMALFTASHRQQHSLTSQRTGSHTYLLFAMNTRSRVAAKNLMKPDPAANRR